VSTGDAARIRDHIADCLEKIRAYADPAVWINLVSPAQVEAQVSRAIDQHLSGRTMPLLGLTLAVKDNIDVACVPTTAACPAFAYTPIRNATAVQRLIDAGAIVVGKTNLDQFATGLVGTRTPYGAPRNVFDARYISGGSSSGSAVAVAAGLVDLSLGTDTAGSGRVPAAFNHLVGLKPTKGLVSTAGVVPACRSLDCVSFFAKSIELARRAFEVARGFDAGDVYSRRACDLPPTSALAQPAFRFGVPADDQLRFFGNDAVRELYAVARHRAVAIGGAEVRIDYDPFIDAAKLLYGGAWVAERLAAVKSLFTSKPEALLPVIRQIVAGGERFTAVDAFEGLYELQRLRRLAEAELQKVDVLLLPTAGTIYTIAEIEADPIALNTNLGYYTNFVNLLDLCALAVPAGFQPNGVPAGVTFVAPAGADDRLAELGRRFLNEPDVGGFS
jgi:allophanate hydrolase